MADQRDVFTGNVRSGPFHEDVLDEIFQITPEETPFYNMIGESNAASVFHSWSTRSLTTRADNRQVEGKEYNIGAMADSSLPARQNNWCQIVDKLPRVTRTEQTLDATGISDLMADQISLRQIELKTDMEHALLRGSVNSGPTNDGDTSAVRALGGFHNILTTGTTVQSPATLTETLFNDMFDRGWQRGASMRDVLVGGSLKRRISGYTASSTKYVFQEDKRITNAVDVYESDFFLTQIHKSHDVPNTATGTLPRLAVYAFDRDMYKKAWLRKPMRRRLADTADDYRAVCVAEFTLEFGHPGAGEKLTGFTT